MKYRLAGKVMVDRVYKSLVGALLVAWLPWSAVVAAPSGEKIYKDNCTRCHGKAGEGVKGKYDDALHGDWSLEKLTRYISKSMPDDDPGSLKHPEAEAVARYVNDAFYSREARARNHPARVELVRLTNRQYINTVADLLRSFSGSDATATAEAGLAATYRTGGRRKEGERKSFERTDREVSFSFGTNFEEFGSIETNSFSVEWRGSFLAPESGDYEFIVKTPNGTRLWVNDENSALIDASVASGSMEEHRARTKLIAGRRYPLRLEASKSAQQKTAAVTLLWKPPRGAEEVIPARALSPSRASSTFVVTASFPADDSSVGYERGVSISKAWDEATTRAAIEVANHVVRNLERLAQTKPSDTNYLAKLQTFCGKFVSTALRRPLTAEQRQVYVERQFQAAAKPEEAVKRVVLLTLKSPRFLYLGLEKEAPDDYEIASRLSYGIWDSLPDAALLKAASEGRLAREGELRKQCARMMEDPRARAKMQQFMQHWLQMNHVEDLSKDAKLYKDFTPEVIADLRVSLNLFLEDVVWSQASDYRQLLLSDYLFVNQRLARFYGVSFPATNAPRDFVKVPADPSQRCGVLTHPYLLATFSYQKTSSPIHRGVFLTRNIVGRALKMPPIAVAFNEAEFKPNMTMREKVTQLTRSEACQTCHSVINPLGFSLENFDAVGRFRSQENDRAIDAVSEYLTDDGGAVRLAGPRDVANFAVNSEHAKNAFIEQLFHHVVKQPMLAYGADAPERLRKSFAESNYNIRDLVIEIAALSARKGAEETVAKNKSARTGKSGS